MGMQREEGGANVADIIFNFRNAPMDPIRDGGLGQEGDVSFFLEAKNHKGIVGA